MNVKLTLLVLKTENQICFILALEIIVVLCFFSVLVLIIIRKQGLILYLRRLRIIFMLSIIFQIKLGRLLTEMGMLTILVHMKRLNIFNIRLIQILNYLK